MTKIWRNGEVKYQMFLYLVIAGMFAGLGFWADTRTGVLLLIACLVFGVFFWTISCRRYREIQKLSEGLDRILHGEEKLELESCREGDLEILRDEIYKICLLYTSSFREFRLCIMVRNLDWKGRKTAQTTAQCVRESKFLKY